MIGALAPRHIKDVLFDPWVVAVSLIVGGIAILLIERHGRAQAPRGRGDAAATALGIGFCQCLAMIPACRAPAPRSSARCCWGSTGRRRPSSRSSSRSRPWSRPRSTTSTRTGRLLSVDDLDVIAVGFVIAFCRRPGRRALAHRLRLAPRLRAVRLVSDRDRPLDGGLLVQHLPPPTREQGEAAATPTGSGARTAPASRDSGLEILRARSPRAASARSPARPSPAGTGATTLSLLQQLDLVRRQRRLGQEAAAAAPAGWPSRTAGSAAGDAAGHLQQVASSAP